MPDNRFEWSADDLADCKDLLWNFVAHLQILKEYQSFIRLALEQFDLEDNHEKMLRVELLLDSYQSITECQFEELEQFQKSIWKLIRPEDLELLTQQERIRPTYFD